MKKMVEQALLPQVAHEQVEVELNGQEQIGRWKAYGEYKNSSIDWLGKIPDAWTTGVLKTYCLLISRGNSPEYVEESSVKVINQACIHNDRLRIENIKYQREQDVSGWKGSLDRDDVLINSTGTGTLGRAIVFDLTGVWIADGHVTIIRPKAQHLFSHYLKYLLQTPLYQGYIYTALVSGSTNQIELSRDKLGSTPLPIPPIYEQHTIATFLDRETTRINTLIAKKEQHIALLQERRTAIINQAVTKGLNADVPMKDSGVEWLGEIPEHWEVRRLKFLADTLPGATKGKDLIGRKTVSLPYLRVANVQDGYLDLSDVDTITVGIDEVERYSLRAGDVLMNEGGDFDKLGRGFIWDGSIDPCLHQNHVFAVRPFSTDDSSWINIITQTSYAKHYFILKSKQSTNLASISKTNIQNLPVVLPPLMERISIITYLNQETPKIDKLITGIQESIKKLKEYSTALISAAVTGKIDVRGEVAAGSVEDATT